MSAIMKLRQARNVEQIAEELQPLALSLATLADQAQASIKELEVQSLRQAREWSIAQESAAAAVRNAAINVKEATASLSQIAGDLKQAQRHQFRNLVTVASMSAILAAQLSIIFWLWLAPVPEVKNTLDAKAVADYLKPAITDALKRR
jgi:hypothetical protein